MNIKVTILIPSLNSSKYIRKCINSAVAQSLNEIEIICIDAGSIDETTEIIREYERSDARVRYLHSPKKSYGYQVNLGIELAKGEYIGIVETDDTIDKDMYKKLYEKAKKNNADFVKADYYEVCTNRNSQIIGKKRRIIENENIYGMLLNPSKMPELLLPDIVAVWSGIYKKTFLRDNQILLNETNGASFQDTGFWLQTQILARRCVYVDEPFYRYTIDNPDSSTFQTSKFFCICDELKFVQSKLPRECLNLFVERLSWIFFRKYKTNLERVPKEEKNNYYINMAEDLKKFNFEYEVKGSEYFEEEWKELGLIIENPIGYLRQKEKETEEFVEIINSYSNIVIYGSGRAGKMLADKLESNNIAGFVVSRLNNETEISVNNRKFLIYQIDIFAKGHENFPVIVASKLADLRQEMKAKASELGYKKIFMIPYGAFDE